MSQPESKPFLISKHQVLEAYKKLRGHRRRAAHWLKRISIRAPKMWAHWAVGVKVTVK